jgi:hypothetical protein
MEHGECSFLTARSTLIHWGITISLKRIERLTYHFGKIGLSLRESKLFQLRQGNLPFGSMLKGQRVVIAVDGGRTRIRINKKGRRNSKTNRHGYVGEWAEPKLLTIYVVDEEGRKIKNSEICITNDGTYNGYQNFLEILEMHLINLGINQALQVLLIADGETSPVGRSPCRQARRVSRRRELAHTKCMPTANP